MEQQLSIVKARRTGIYLFTEREIPKYSTQGTDIDHLTVLLSVDLLVVELEFRAFEDVTISTTALTRAGRNASQKTTGGELFGESGIEDSILVTGSKSVLDALALLGFLLSLSFLGLLLSELNTIVLLVPLTERSSIDLDNAVLHQGVGTDQLVVGGVVQNS